MRNKFTLEFNCIELTAADGKTKIRAVVLAVAPMADPMFLLAGLALDNGQMIQKPIKRIDFDTAKKVTMIETDDVRGPNAGALLYGANGGKVL